MTVGGRYLATLALAAAAAAGVGMVTPEQWRAGWWLALGLTLCVQSLLGWLLVRSVGGVRFLGIWVLGMLLRLALVGVVGLWVLPRLPGPAAPALLALVGFLVGTLVLEGAVLTSENARAEVR